VRGRRGGGAAHVDPVRRAPETTAPEQVSTQRGGIGAQGLCAHARSLTPCGGPFSALAPGSPQARAVRRSAHPLRSRLLEKLVPLDGRLALEPVVNSAGSWMSQDGQRLALALVLLHAGASLRARRMGASTAHGRFRERPWERGGAHLAPRGAGACPRRFLGAGDETAIGHERWDAGDALEGRDVIQPHHAQDRADPRDRAPQVEGVGVVRRGRGADNRAEAARYYNLNLNTPYDVTFYRGRIPSPGAGSVLIWP